MKKTSIISPSEKNITSENFPVASWIIPKSLRNDIVTLYNFARTADNIADNPKLSDTIKLAKLDQFDSAISASSVNRNQPLAIRDMIFSLKKTGINISYCINLITAFKQDISKNRYKTWLELINYCQLSAAPIGRYLIDLNGGFITPDNNYYKHSDALCTALQILNHLQDCKDDLNELDRVYIPEDIMAACNTSIKDLKANRSTPEFQICKIEIIDRVDKLIYDSEQLPNKLKSKRLAIETCVIINIARALSKKLRIHDPLVFRIKLSKLHFFWCFLFGIIKFSRIFINSSIRWRTSKHLV